jgi:CRISPR system Cascade subunit CasB
MNSRRDREDRFVKHLESLRDRGDRAALARLRRGLGRAPGTVAETFPLVQPRLPEGMPPRQENAFYLVASLFASHPGPGEAGNLGAAFARLAAQRDSASIEQRFVALLNCHEDDLPGHLRHAVSLLAASDVPVNWRQLLADVQRWGHPGRPVQRQWARNYWAGNGPAEE